MEKGKMEKGAKYQNKIELMAAWDDYTNQHSRSKE